MNGLQTSSNVLKIHCTFSVLQHGQILHVSYRVHRGYQNIFQQVTDFCVCYAALFQLIIVLSCNSPQRDGPSWAMVGTGLRNRVPGGVASSSLPDELTVAQLTRI